MMLSVSWLIPCLSSLDPLQTYTFVKNSVWRMVSFQTRLLLASPNGGAVVRLWNRQRSPSAEATLGPNGSRSSIVDCQPLSHASYIWTLMVLNILIPRFRKLLTSSTYIHRHRSIRTIANQTMRCRHQENLSKLSMSAELVLILPILDHKSRPSGPTITAQ